MEFLEKDLEDILYNAPVKDIENRGLYCFRHHALFRQVNLGSYGIADLVSVCFSRKDRIIVTVYELKQKTISINTFLQAVGYVKGLQEVCPLFNIKKRRVDFHIVLIGSKIDLSGQFCYLPSVFPHGVSYYTYKYDYDGIKFCPEDEYKLPHYKPPISTVEEIGFISKFKYREFIKSLPF